MRSRSSLRADRRAKRRTDKGPAPAEEDLLAGIKPVGKRQPVADMVYQALKGAITHGELKPGQRLVEQKLSDRLRVSRVPVREAIKRLEQAGFVKKLPARGVVVHEMTEEDMDEAFEARAILESHTTVQACEYVTGELIAALEENIEASSKALLQGDTEAAARLDDMFHEMIYRAAKKRVINALIHTLMDYPDGYRKRLLSRKRRYGEASLEGHRAIVAALRRKDKEAAGAAARSHVLWDRLLVMAHREGRKVEMAMSSTGVRRHGP